MLKRIIPTMLLQADGLYKTRKFKDPVYIGDPINAIKIFNDKLVDEILVMDIQCTRKGTPVQYELLREMAGECFMPLCYGGGVKDIETVRNLLQSGIERVAITSALVTNRAFVQEAARIFGSSALVGGIDYKKDIFGRNRVYIRGGMENTKLDPVDLAKAAADAGIGELLLHNIEREGTYSGYDLEMLDKVAAAVDVPLIILGGAKDISDLQAAFSHGAGAVAAGSLFVFKGGRGSVLINYPRRDDLEKLTH